MSENSNETGNETVSTESATEQPSDQSCQQPTGKSCCKRGRHCRPHTTTLISIIALLLAGYAAFTVNSGHDTTILEARISTLDSQISAINKQIATLNEAVKSNRENLIQTKLKKALQNIQDIGNLAGESTKAAISEVENMLKTLTSISLQLNTPAHTKASPTKNSEPLSVSATSPETITSETIPQQPATAEPATHPVNSGIADQSAATTETTPTQSSGAPSKTQPKKDRAATTTPSADVTPATEPSAPQAF